MEIQIAVIGPSDCTDEEYAAAREVGRRIAEEGAVLISGGLGGVMEASCQGAKTAGGRTVGILPGISGGNPYLDVVIRTGISYARNVLVVQSGDAVVAVGGDGHSFGTLSEIGIAVKTGKVVLGLRTWNIPGVIQCDTPEEAVLRAVRAARR